MVRMGSDFPVLIAQAGALNGQRWQVERPLTIGRDDSCDIFVADRQVSRFHARISPQDEGVLLEDLGSKNGTFCNSKLVAEPRLLEDGDVVQVALVQQFVYLSSDATMPLDAGIGVGHQPGGRLFLDTLSRRVWVGSDEITPPLSAPQFRLLQALYEQPGRVVNRRELVAAIWGEEEIEGVSEQAFDALVRRLRDRLALIDPKRVYLVTVRGHGLRLENPSD